jgi:hypothetical protein
VGAFVLQIFLGNGENFEIMKGTAEILGIKEARLFPSFQPAIDQ